jgi:hypothetical protein
MLKRDYSAKSITEFYTARENTLKPISCITRGYRYSAPQDSTKIQYITRTLSKTSSKPELPLKDKYKIFSGKLHIYQQHSESYIPIETNNYIDITRITARMKQDSQAKKTRMPSKTPVLWNKEEEPHANTNLCTREAEKQMKSVLLLTSRSGFDKKSATSSISFRNLTSRSTFQYKTPSEILSERCVTSSYTVSRL